MAKEYKAVRKLYTFKIKFKDGEDDQVFQHIFGYATVAEGRYFQVDLGEGNWMIFPFDNILYISATLETK